MPLKSKQKRFEVFSLYSHSVLAKVTNRGNNLFKLKTKSPTWNKTAIFWQCLAHTQNIPSIVAKMLVFHFQLTYSVTSSMVSLTSLLKREMGTKVKWAVRVLERQTEVIR